MLSFEVQKYLIFIKDHLQERFNFGGYKIKRTIIVCSISFSVELCASSVELCASSYKVTQRATENSQRATENFINIICTRFPVNVSDR